MWAAAVPGREPAIKLFKRLTPIFRGPVSWPIVDPDRRNEFMRTTDALTTDLEFLAVALEPTFGTCDTEALREQNRYRRQQLVVLAGGVTGAVVGALEAVFAKAVWLGALVALLALLSVVYAQAMRKRRALEQYVDYRVRAERLRSLYFQYVTRVEPFGDDDRQDRLKAEVAVVKTQNAASGNGNPA